MSEFDKIIGYADIKDQKRINSSFISAYQNYRIC